MFFDRLLSGLRATAVLPSLGRVLTRVTSKMVDLVYPKFECESPCESEEG